VSQKIRFPYKLESTFFTEVHFQRKEVVPEPLDLSMGLQLKTNSNEMPGKLHVALKFETTPDQPITIILELIGTFIVVDEDFEADGDFVIEFINERVAFMLWPHISQMVRSISGQMGIASLNIPTPYAYFFGDDE
jgi:hypothetical protein